MLVNKLENGRGKWDCPLVRFITATTEQISALFKLKFMLYLSKEKVFCLFVI